MRTRVLPAGAESVRIAAEALRRGGCVGLPTETVYGLAANALDPLACARIFEAKERPLSDPLIVHFPDLSWLARLAVADALAIRLAGAFWPGPLTLVLPRTDLVPDLVTAGQDTVAVRMSAHPVFREIITAFGSPLAAPSANRFGRISPTRADHVMAELGGRIEWVVDGGPCEHGIESTIARIANGKISILRHGPISEAELREFGPVRETNAGAPVVPGSMKSHYAPVTRLEISAELVTDPSSRTGLLAFGPVEASGYERIEVLSASGDLQEAAANLYGAMRRLDDAGLDLIVAEPVPETGLGVAIMERLRKAAARE